MNRSKTTTPLPFGEFVALMAMIMALVALATDAMLPALAEIGQELGVQRANSSQLVVSFLFLGLATGQIIYGPVSESIGRKPAIYAGYAIFFVGCLLSLVAASFPVMLAGRLLQGLGLAGPRSVTTAVIRDQYDGRRMARVMSFIMVVFILVPAIAPSFGQAVLLLASWRAIFGALLLMALATLTWFALRQPETLPAPKRRAFSPRWIVGAVREVLANRIAFGYTLGAGLISGAFLGYINSAQQVYQGQYGLGTRFPLYFAAVALAIGSASFINGRLVMRFGMRSLSQWSLRGLLILAWAFSVVAFFTAGNPPLPALMLFFITAFFCVGILFGNLNALAMEPLGHIAGVGAAVVGSLSTFIATPLGILIGQAYNGTILPLVLGFAVLSLVSMLIMRWAEQSAIIPTPASAGIKPAKVVEAVAPVDEI